MEDMDELSARLSSLLDSAEGMEQIKNLAEGLFSGKGEAPKGDSAPAFGGLDPSDLQTIMQLGNLLRSDTDDSRTKLLLALKPHLSEKRQDRVDRAIKLLRIASVLPLISAQGIF